MKHKEIYNFLNNSFNYNSRKLLETRRLGQAQKMLQFGFQIALKKRALCPRTMVGLYPADTQTLPSFDALILEP